MLFQCNIYIYIYIFFFFFSTYFWGEVENCSYLQNEKRFMDEEILSTQRLDYKIPKNKKIIKTKTKKKTKKKKQAEMFTPDPFEGFVSI